MFDFLMLLAGFLPLIFGANMLVDSASSLAKRMNIPDIVIGLTIVAFGTSAPELATSAIAAVKKNSDIAIGNVVGSNIFNLFFVLGVSTVIHPAYPQAMTNLDMLVNVAATLLLFIFIFTGKERKIERWEGIFFVCGYIAYIAVLLAL